MNLIKLITNKTVNLKDFEMTALMNNNSNSSSISINSSHSSFASSEIAKGLEVVS